MLGEKTVTGMAKYIDREALVEWLKRIPLKDLSDGRGLCRVIFEDDFKRAIKKIPKGIIVDVAPVRHGRWMKAKNKKDYWGFDSDGDFGCWSDYPVLCSSCKYDATENSTGETNYCPNCGAKMDGGADNA